MMRAGIQTFGQAVAHARKAQGLSQKDLAGRIHKEDGQAITPQYLNDIEHDRRSPSSDHMVKEFAAVLGQSPDYLSWLVGKLPADIRESKAAPEKVDQAFVAFRQVLSSGR
jgi:transcriptional regulator with XRE-family HTH domain